MGHLDKLKVGDSYLVKYKNHSCLYINTVTSFETVGGVTIAAKGAWIWDSLHGIISDPHVDSARCVEASVEYIRVIDDIEKELALIRLGGHVG